ncbi:MAG: ABC transporter permease [Sciscionella sp.]
MGLFTDMAHFFTSRFGFLMHLVGTHMLLSVIVMLVAIVIALPIGVLIGHLHRFSFVAINVGNVLRALPTPAIVAVVIGFYGLGFVNILIALVILAVPLILTNAYVGVAEVEPGIVQAARGMGLTGWQTVWRVELPNAVPLIMAGIRTAMVYVIATTYLAALAGYTGTLGDIIFNQTEYRIDGILVAAVLSVVLAFLAELVLAVVERLLTSRGLRVSLVSAVV